MKNYLATTITLLLVVLRGRHYTVLFAAVLVPILLSTVLYSIPSVKTLELVIPEYNSPIVVYSESPIGNYYPSRIVEGLLEANNTSVDVKIMVVKMEAQYLNPLVKCSNCTSGVLLPRDLYTSLGKPGEVVVAVDGFTGVYSVLGYWSSNLVLLLDSELLVEPEGYICTANRQSVLTGFLEGLEYELLATAGLWILVLTLVYTPLVYIAHERLVDALKPELRQFYENGVNPRTLYLSTLTTLLSIHVLVVLYITALGVVLVYTAWSILSAFIPSPPPVLRENLLTPLSTQLLLGFILASIASRGVIRVSSGL